MIDIHANQKYVAAKEALKAAKDISILSKGHAEQAITVMEKASSMPVDALRTHIWNVYKEKEPERVQDCVNTALGHAKGDSINDKDSIGNWLKYAQEHSEMPLAQKVINHIHQEYIKHEPERVQACVNTALGHARGDSINDKDSIGNWLKYAQEHSEMPISQAVIDNVYQEYIKHEPQRKYAALKVALGRARGDSIIDKDSMISWLKYAQEHSEMPLAKTVIDHVCQEYIKHEPQRKYAALRVALGHAKGDSIIDKDLIRNWLKYAQEHSHGLIDKVLTYFTGLGIKGKYALRPLLSNKTKALYI
jgi:hypothetical protein